MNVTTLVSNGTIVLCGSVVKQRVKNNLVVCVTVPVVRQREKLEGDSSLMTYRGHSVLHTLVRSRFSPAHTTGHRYIYTGCATGAVVSESQSHAGVIHICLSFSDCFIPVIVSFGQLSPPHCYLICMILGFP